MPQISVVVPIYNVERYLTECLESIARQTVSDLEVVMVDDGSTDASAALAESFAKRDPRFRLIRQPNGGLGRARNMGTEAATGRFLAFVDSDDVLPPRAYELLLSALEKSGSDFATGNIKRLQRGRESPWWGAEAFSRTRLKTHVTKFRALLADRTAPNKLWRRTFWDGHNLRFPENVVHEDIPVVIPAHFLARSVDVIRKPVYHYRVREGGERSITQRLLEERVLLDRLAAIQQVCDFLARQGLDEAKRWYEESVVADDLRRYVNWLDDADEDYRALFLERVNAFLDGADRRVFDPLPAIDRLKWHLVRRRLVPQLLEVLRFEREDLHATPAVRIRRRWYGDYPFRTDRSLRIPLSVYRLNQELAIEAGIDELRLTDGRLDLEGFAYIEGIGAPAPGSQQVTLALWRPGRLGRLRRETTRLRARGASRHRPDVTARTRQAATDPSWSGFAASFDLRRLRLPAGWREGTWQLYATVRVAGFSRRSKRFEVIGHQRPLRAVDKRLSDEIRIRVRPSRSGVVLEMQREWASVHTHALAEGAVELGGELQGAASGAAELEVSWHHGTPRRYPLHVEAGGSSAQFTARVPVDDLVARNTSTPTDGQVHVRPKDTLAPLAVVDTNQRHELALPDATPEGVWSLGDRAISLLRTRQGGATLSVGPPRPVILVAHWTNDDELELECEDVSGPGLEEFVLRTAEGLEYRWPAKHDAYGRVHGRLTPARLPSLAGTLPLRAGTWQVYARKRGEVADDNLLLAVVVSESLYYKLPLQTVLEHKAFVLGMKADGQAALFVQRDLDDGERGAYNQHRLRHRIYAHRRTERLRDAVLYSSFGGRQFSDSPRAIHEELVRQGAALEHLWIVRDRSSWVPPTASLVRAGSREFHDALARARYVVFNDHFPDWFHRRPDQTCLQTWRGTPLKRLGFGRWPPGRPIRQFQRRRWAQQVANWQYVLSPNQFSTPFLREAFAIEGEILETGLPRTDKLAAASRAEANRRLRVQLGLPLDIRTILYAPTYRDQVVDRRGRLGLDWRLDIRRLSKAVGPETVILVRKHPHVFDPVPVTDEALIRDVSAFPDATELMLAADVLITDYSSMMFDYASTGRPMLLFTYDLEAYEEKIRGLTFDLRDAAPGPLLRTTDEVIEALQNLPAVTTEYRDRYGAFVSEFCELDDGHASERVVERLFPG